MKLKDDLSMGVYGVKSFNWSLRVQKCIHIKDPLSLMYLHKRLVGLEL